jgi:hypothetical protein
VPERDLQWRTSLRADEAWFVVFDRTGQYRIDRVALVGPGGQAVPAREMTRENQGGNGRPGFGVFGSGGSRGMNGVGVGIDIPVGSDPGSLERRTSAVIPLPQDYRRTAPQWKIEVDMTTPDGSAYHATIPAPTP